MESNGDRRDKFSLAVAGCCHSATPTHSNRRRSLLSVTPQRGEAKGLFPAEFSSACVSLALLATAASNQTPLRTSAQLLLSSEPAYTHLLPHFYLQGASQT